MKTIVTVPNPVLIHPADEVTAFDRALKSLVTHMNETLIATVNPKGVGLAATQIGVALRIFVTKPTVKSEIRTFINPVILSRSEEKTNGIPERENKMEGCLSIPKIWGNVHRATSLTLKYQDVTGTSHEEVFKGFLATIIQHETDHINGILFTQRVLEQKEKLYQITEDEDGKEVLDEIKI